MKKRSIFWKSVGYSLSLTYSSNKISLVIYLIIKLLMHISPLLSIFFLRSILNELSTNQTDNLFLYVSIFFIIIILNQLFRLIESLLKNIITEKTSLQYDLFVSKKLDDLPMSFLDSSKGRDIVDDLKYCRNTTINMPNYIFSIILSSITFIIAYLTLIQFDVFFSILFLLLTIPGIISQVIIERKVDIFRIKSAPDVRKFSYYRWVLTGALPAKDVRMYDLTNPIKSRYDEEKHKYRKANKALDIRKLIISILTELIKRSGEIVFTVYIIIQALNGKVTIGDVTLYIGFALSATASFENSTFLSVSLYFIGTKSLGRFFDFIDIKDDDRVKQTRKLEGFSSLEFDNVIFKYPSSDKDVLKGTSFTLNKGDRLSIVGINGSGKSTIVKLILGLYKPQSGHILINGYPFSDYHKKDVRKMFSVLFQDFVQFPLTLRENIALSDIQRISNDEDIISSMKSSGIYDNYEKFDNGLDSNMTRRFDEKGVELSKGQWQKIALSRAYFKNAPIIIFDEPSSALDAEAEDRIFQDFKNIANNKTGIMISHRISSAKISNKIIVLDDGRIVEQGFHDDLVHQNGLYAELYHLQQQKYTLKEEGK